MRKRRGVARVPKQTRVYMYKRACFEELGVKYIQRALCLWRVAAAPLPLKTQ